MVGAAIGHPGPVPVDAEKRPPLVVDMDGTLLKTDVLFEGLAAAATRKPLATLAALPLLLFGRARLKARIAEIADIDIEALPVREELVARLEAERAAGRELHLVTAADQKVAEQVAERVGLFDSVQGSANGRNLKGGRKAETLIKRFPNGFTYAGDSGADLKVWRKAKGVIFCGPKLSVARRARTLGVPVEAEFPQERPSLSRWRKALRLHQWAKNLLVFVPLLLGHMYLDPTAWAKALAAFLLLGVTASGTYVINDLSDLAADRRHRTKKNRPFAAGEIPVAHGLIAAPLMVVGGLAAAAALSPPFAMALSLYVASTLAYSLYFKRAPLLDVFLLGGLYTLRILMGVLVLGQQPTAWLLTFSFFFFLSLSLAKRQVELARALAAGQARLPGRGYKPEDAPLTLAFGVGTGVAAILILAIYLVDEAFPSGFYQSPMFLWAAPALLMLWIMRIWLLAHRAELDDDPVAFAVRDPMSLGLGALIGFAFMGAILL